MINVDDLKDIVGVTASIFTIIQFLSGVLVCRKFVQNGTTGDSSPFPFISGFLSTSLWLRYANLIDDWNMILVNAAGAALFSTYSLTFLFYSIKKWNVLRYILGCLIILAFILGYSQVEYDDVIDIETSELMISKVGTLCCLVSVIFFASPLASLHYVIKKKSSESLPFPLILASFIVCCQWYFYGILIEDHFVQIPNFLGALLSAIQLSLFFLYPKPYKPLDNEI